MRFTFVVMMVVTMVLDYRNPELGYFLPVYVRFTFLVTMVATTVSDYKNPEWGYVIWNHILAAYMRFTFVVMMVVTTVLDYRNPELGHVIWNHILAVYMRFTFVVMMVVTTVLDYRNPELGYVIWNHILTVYMRFIFVVMMVAEQGRATELVVYERVEQGRIGMAMGRRREGGGEESSEGRLLEMCVRAACRDMKSVRAWRQKRRTLEMLPSELAERLFHRLLQAHLLSPPLIELFQRTIQEADLSGVGNVDGEWMAYIGGCHHLRVLCATDCKLLMNNAIWQLTGLTAMEELDLARCRRISDEAVFHIVSLRGLKKLGLAETGVGAKGISLLPVLSSLTYLDLGGCPVTDEHLIAFQALEHLEHLDLWGSKVTNKGAQGLTALKFLKSVNLAMTKVTVILRLDSLTRLNLCNCSVESIFQEDITVGCLLKELFLSGSDFSLRDSISGLNLQNVHLLDLASARVRDLDALVHMQELSILDLSYTGLTDAFMPKFSEFGKNLTWLDLSNTKIGSEGIGALAGHVPKLEQLSLSGTLVDDHVFEYLVHFPALCSVNLSSSKVEGSMKVGSQELVQVSVLSYLQQLQNLRRLDLQYTGVMDSTFDALTTLTQLTHLNLQSPYLTDECLQQTSCLPNLVCMEICGSVVTDGGLHSFNPPPLLEELDLSDCWLLSEDAVLDFCEAQPHIMVWNEKTVSVVNIFPKLMRTQEYGDLVSGERATSFTRELQVTKVKARKSPIKSSSKGLSRLSKKSPNKGSQASGGSTDLLIKMDERIKYAKEELLSLKTSTLTNLSSSSLRDLDGLLEIRIQNRRWRSVS